MTRILPCLRCVSFDCASLAPPPTYANENEAIAHTSEQLEQRIDWTSAWGKRYPVLLKYRDQINVAPYAEQLRQMLGQIRTEAGYSDQDAMLALKDILYCAWKDSRKRR